MPNFADNLDVIDANGRPTNVLLQDRGTLAMANNLVIAVGDISNLKTIDKSNVVNAINEVFTDVSRYQGHWITPEDFGAVGDGVTDDTDVVQDCIDDGRPVRFVNDYAVTSIKFKYGESTRLLDGNDHYIIALDTTKSPVEFCTGGAMIYRLGIRQNRTVGEAPALYWHSENGHASNFNIFYELRFDYCYHCIQYGDGTEIAQSENRIVDMFTYACNVMINTHGRLLQLWVDNSILNSTHFEAWQDSDAVQMFTIGAGSLLFLNNCTIENVNFETQNGIICNGELFIDNSAFEIAGVNLACFQQPSAHYDNDGSITVTNCRFFQGGTAKAFCDVNLNGSITLDNCYIKKLTPYYLFVGHNDGSTINIDHVKTENVSLQQGSFNNMNLYIENSVFSNLKRISGGYVHIGNNDDIASPTNELELFDNGVYGNYEAVITDSSASLYVGVENNYMLIAGGTPSTYKGAFIYVSPNNKVGIVRNYMDATNSTVKGGLCYT